MALYRLLYLPALLLALPYYAWRMWRRGGYRKGFKNRFGLMDNVPPKRQNVKRIWVQAVSVGELLAIAPLLRKLHENPAVEVVLTTTTSTGIRLLEEKLADKVVWHGVFPLDFWPCNRAAWLRLQPDVALLMEGELWPEHIHQADLRSVPVILANARLSDKSFARHQRMAWLARAYFKKLTAVLAGSASDQERFRALGWLPEGRVRLIGNLKLDVEIGNQPTQAERAAELNSLGFPSDAFVLLGSSTWPGEEAALVDAFQHLRARYPQLRLLLVPRHAERRREVVALLEESGLSWHQRSIAPAAQQPCDIHLADTTGELKQLTRFADLVFVGKSLPPNVGGQTPVEAAAFGKPLIFGPSMSNFRDISRSLLEAKAALQLADAADLGGALESLLADDAARQQMGARAASLIRSSSGATERLAAALLRPN